MVATIQLRRTDGPLWSPVSVGAAPQLALSYLDAAGRLVAPTAAVLLARAPDGSVRDFSAALSNSATGYYVAAPALGLAGTWRFTAADGVGITASLALPVQDIDGTVPGPAPDDGGAPVLQLPEATETAHGLLSAADKTKLNGIANQATRVTAPADIGAASAAALSSEATTRANADSTNAAAISAETARAQGAESTLTSAISAEATARANADSANATAISAETTRAQGAESTLTSAISAEATTRASADSANATAISAETTRAQAAELTATLLAAMASGAAACTTTIAGNIVTDAYSFAGSSWTVTTTIAGNTVTETWSAPFSTTHVTTLAGAVISRS